MPSQASWRNLDRKGPQGGCCGRPLPSPSLSVSGEIVGRRWRCGTKVARGGCTSHGIWNQVSWPFPGVGHVAALCVSLCWGARPAVYMGHGGVGRPASCPDPSGPFSAPRTPRSPAFLSLLKRRCSRWGLVMRAEGRWRDAFGICCYPIYMAPGPIPAMLASPTNLTVPHSHLLLHQRSLPRLFSLLVPVRPVPNIPLSFHPRLHVVPHTDHIPRPTKQRRIPPEDGGILLPLVDAAVSHHLL